eukprot:2813974-Amphidinium_carterae.2
MGSPYVLRRQCFPLLWQVFDGWKRGVGCHACLQDASPRSRRASRAINFAPQLEELWSAIVASRMLTWSPSSGSPGMSRDSQKGMSCRVAAGVAQEQTIVEQVREVVREDLCACGQLYELICLYSSPKVLRDKATDVLQTMQNVSCSYTHNVEYMGSVVLMNVDYILKRICSESVQSGTITRMSAEKLVKNRSEVHNKFPK